MAIKNHLPPSSAGIGKTFIQASDTEIRAARKAKFEGPAAVNDGNKTPIIPTGPVTESPTVLIASLPLSRTFPSKLSCCPTPEIKFQTNCPRPLNVSPVSCKVSPAPQLVHSKSNKIKIQKTSLLIFLRMRNLAR